LGVAFSIPIANVFAASAFAREGLVAMADGRTFEGQITEKGDEIIVRVKGIETTLSRADILAIEYGTFGERFEKALSTLKNDDVTGRVKLARDALSRNELDLANKAVGEALDIDPLDRPAREVFDLITQRAKARENARDNSGASPTPTPAPETDASPTPAPPTRERGDQLITPEKINEIRQKELRPDDTRVRVRFANNVRKRYVDGVPNYSYGDFISQSDTQQALEIIARGKKDMVPDVLISTDPPALLEYGRKVQGGILQGCATSQCHGGANNGGFVLISPSRSVEDNYINFHTLVLAEQSVGNEAGADAGGLFSGPSKRKLIDRESPDESLLLAYGLPLAKSRYPHPELKGFVAIFRDTNDPQYRMVRDWIGSLKTPSPSYAASASAGAPASAPAPAPAPAPTPAPAPQTPPK